MPRTMMKCRRGILLLAALGFGTPQLLAGSLDIPSSDWGVSIGNSIRFTGLRLNFRDHGVDRVRGVNLTVWSGYSNEMSTVSGFSTGLIPSAGELNGLAVGLLGAGADRDMKGVMGGLLGAGAGGNLTGLAAGGLGAGVGGDAHGLLVGGLGAGAGGNIRGIALGGLGVGAGDSLTGIGIGLLGVGAGSEAKGIMAGGLGAGVGGSVTGLALGGLGAGVGDSLTGVGIGGLGIGAGDSIQGVAIGGLAVGAGNSLTGVMLAGGCVKVDEDGHLKGLSVSAFNWNRGHQTGLAIGLVNTAESLDGVQIGLINIVGQREGWSRVLPLLNVSL